MWLGTPEVIPKLVIKLFALELFALRQRPIDLLCSRTTRWKGLPTFRSTILEDLKGLKGVFKWCGKEEERIVILAERQNAQILKHRLNLSRS
jgi:hypothetical protein